MGERDELLKKHNEYESYLIELIDSVQELSDESFEERVKREFEISQLESEIKAEVESNDNFCDLCGRQMVPQNKEHIELLCMNPKCDNYIKIQK